MALRAWCGLSASDPAETPRTPRSAGPPHPAGPGPVAALARQTVRLESDGALYRLAAGVTQPHAVGKSGRRPRPTSAARSTNVDLRHRSSSPLRDVLEVCLQIVSKLERAGGRATDQVAGDEFVDQRPKSFEIILTITTSRLRRRTGPRLLAAVGESRTHLIMVTWTTDDGQGQRSRFGPKFKGRGGEPVTAQER
jgi:hypothetical protein